MIIRTYSELITFKTFDERFEYLKVPGIISEETFGPYRYLYQDFLHSWDWRKIRHRVITRDHACDLGVEGYEMTGHILIHHLNPITKEDILNGSPFLTDPEYLISTCKRTHNMIHYGCEGDKVYSHMTERSPDDTCPWKRRI